MNTNDPRIQELETLAREEGIRLPMAPMLICWFEDRGLVVDLHTGLAWRTERSGMPTRNAKAICYLLAG